MNSVPLAPRRPIRYRRARRSARDIDVTSDRSHTSAGHQRTCCAHCIARPAVLRVVLLARTQIWDLPHRACTTILTNNKMGAEPPSLYDGTSTCTQIAQHSARKCSSTCSLFVNTVHHTRTIACVPNSAKCSLALTMDTQQVGCAQTTKRCTPARLNQRRTAHQFTQLVHSVTICRTALCVRSPPFQRRSTQTIANEQ